MKSLFLVLALLIARPCHAVTRTVYQHSADKTVSIYVTAVIRVMDIAISTDNKYVIRDSTKAVEYMGSGVYISSNGHILTCAHLFEDRDIRDISVMDNSGYYYKGLLLFKDEKKDLALLKTWTKNKRYAKLRTRKAVLGETVIAVGNPLGVSGTLTQGIVSAVTRETNSGSHLQHQAFINPGNSGGPLFDARGQLLGINVRIIIPSQANPVFTGIALAVKQDDISRFLELFRGVQ